MNTIVVAHEDLLSVITLNRPERRNAISFEMVDELMRALDECEASLAQRGYRSLLITGAGAAFCSGMDLETLRAIGRQDEAQNVVDSERMARLFQRVFSFPAPTIAAVNGAAVAGGCGLASVCDFTVSVPEAKFGYTEVRIGFIPAIVSIYLLRLVGEKHARDLLLSGRLISAAEARNIGLVTEIVTADKLQSRVREIAAELAKNSPASLRATKDLLARLPVYSLQPALDTAVKENAAIRRTPDFREGLSAFLEKRTPLWQRAGSQ
jgi:methylglutaconyl-CoA hydratase